MEDTALKSIITERELSPRSDALTTATQQGLSQDEARDFIWLSDGGARTPKYLGHPQLLFPGAWRWWGGVFLEQTAELWGRNPGDALTPYTPVNKSFKRKAYVGPASSCTHY